MIESVETPPQPEIEYELPGDAPIILEEWFKDLVAIVEIGLCAGLCVSAYLAEQEVCEGVARRVTIVGVESELSLNVSGGLLILLRESDIGPEEECMVSVHSGHDIAIRVGGVGVLPGEVTGVHRETPSAVNGSRCIANGKGGYLICFAECCREEGCKIDAPGGKADLPKGTENNMVSGVASDKLIQQCRRNTGGQTSHEATCRPIERGVGIVEGVVIHTPKRALIDGAPTVVDVAEGQALTFREIVIHADQFFPPMGVVAWIHHVSWQIGSSRLTRLIGAHHPCEIVCRRNQTEQSGGCRGDGSRQRVVRKRCPRW